MMNFQSILNVLLAFIIIFGSSCGKRKLKKGEISAFDNAKAESMFVEMFDQGADASKQEEGAGKKESVYSTLDKLPSCATASFHWNNDSTYLNKIVIDYGNGCKNSNGKELKGTLTVTKDAKFFIKNASITIEPGNNFSIDGYQIEGTKTVTNLGLEGDTSNNIITWEFDVEVRNGKITTPEDETLTWESDRTHTWEWQIGCGDPPCVFFMIDGSAEGKDRKDRAYTATITSTLIWKAGCPHIREGVLEIDNEDLKDPAIIDYGNGACDNEAEVTVGNKSKTINLNERS